MRKLFLLVIPFLFFVSCPSVDPPYEPAGPYFPNWNASYASWNDFLESHFGREFGWMAANGLSGVREPITHNMTAMEYLFAMGINAGWNMGNTYDATWALSHVNLYGTGHFDRLFEGIKAAGFNIIRIPISWSSNQGPNSPRVSGWTVFGDGVDGTINDGAIVVNPAFLNELEQVVTAAHRAGLVTFINTHHDKGPFHLNVAGRCLLNNPDGDGADFLAMTRRFTEVWRQVAEHFRDFGDWLIFESLNEPTIRDPFPGGAIRWEGAPPQYHEVLNRWNQAFIDVVRETGGNNEKRYLIFKAYAGKWQPFLDVTNRYRIPTDPSGRGRLIFSFHAYIPQPLTLEGQNTSWSIAHRNMFITQFAQVRNFFMIEHGIPLLKGETGATFHSQRGAQDSITANTNRLLVLNALGYFSQRYGSISVLWDNGEATRGAAQSDPNGETFALFRRTTNHDTNVENWGLPIDHTLLQGGSNPRSTGGAVINANNAARDNPYFGIQTINAFIDAVNRHAPLGTPDMRTTLTRN